MMINIAMEFKYPKYFVEYGINLIKVINRFSNVNFYNKKVLSGYLRCLYLSYSEFSNYSFLIYTNKKLLKSTFFKTRRLKLTNKESIYTWKELVRHLKNFEMVFYNKFVSIENFDPGLVPVILYEGAFTVNLGDIYEELYRIFIHKNKNISEFKVSLMHILFNHDDYLKMIMKVYITHLEGQDV